MRSGESVAVMRVLLSGAVEIWDRGPGRAARVASLSRGDAIGEIELLSHRRARLEAVADGDVETLAIDRLSLDAFLLSEPLAALAMAEHMARAADDASGPTGFIFAAV